MVGSVGETELCVVVVVVARRKITIVFFMRLSNVLRSVWTAAGVVVLDGRGPPPNQKRSVVNSCRKVKNRRSEACELRSGLSLSNH